MPAPGHHPHTDTAIWNLIRAYAADEIRNRHMAQALSDFYRLAAVEAQWDLARQAEKLLLEHQRRLEMAIQQGVRPPQDLSPVHRQLLETRTRLAQLHSARIALNAALVERLGLSDPEPPIWPQVVLRVDPRDVSVAAAIPLANTYRPDLNLLRLLSQLKSRSLNQAQGWLQAIHPLLGDSFPRRTELIATALRKGPTAGEQRWQAQIQAALQTRQHQASAEVQTAIALRQGHRIVAWARQAQVDFWQQQLTELEKREAAGQAVSSELLTARLELLQAQAALLEAVADWYQADVQLQQALGLLVRE
jgi:outer membrane protein TolC